jgi:hypothetical protein
VNNYENLLQKRKHKKLNERDSCQTPEEIIQNLKGKKKVLFE